MTAIFCESKNPATKTVFIKALMTLDLKLFLEHKWPQICILRFAEHESLQIK